MNTFTWLLMGHLIGDWVLQNDWMAKDKRRGWVTPGGLAHFAIYTATSFGALVVSGQNDPSFCLAPGLVIFVSHWLIDAGDVAGRWMHLFRQSDLTWVRVVVDQTLHLLVLMVLAMFSFGM
jgi:hypothetical protein